MHISTLNCMALQPYANVCILVYQYTQKDQGNLVLNHATTGIECFATVICMIDALQLAMHVINIYMHDYDTFKSLKCSLVSLQVTVSIEVRLI